MAGVLDQFVPFNRRGRPSRAGEPARERIEFCVTAAERQALEKMASQEGRPLATVIRDAVNEFVSDYGERRPFRAK